MFHLLQEVKHNIPLHIYNISDHTRNNINNDLHISLLLFSNTVKPHFIIFIGVLQKNDEYGKTIDVGAIV
jgi:hypothetical protein